MNKCTKSLICDRLPLFAVFGLGIALPLSTALLSVFSILLLVCWLFTGKFRQVPHLFMTNPVARLALLLLAMFFIGLTYSAVDAGEGFGWLQKYRELLLIVVLIPFLTDNRVRTWAVQAFFLGVLISLLVSYAMATGMVPAKDLGFSILSRITHNTFMAFFTFWAAHNLAGAGKHKWLWATALGLAVFNIFFMVPGRTGQVIFVGLALLFLFQRFSWRYRLIGVGLLFGVLCAFMFLSGNFSERIAQMETGIQEYKDNATSYSDGVAFRLEFVRNSLVLVRKRPVFGYGTGSFTKVYREVALANGQIPTENPHNEYILIAIQLGIVGVMLFVFLLVAVWTCSKRLAREDAWLAQGLVLTMAVGCLVNSWLLDAHEGHFFAYFAAISCATFSSRPTSCPQPPGPLSLARTSSDSTGTLLEDQPEPGSTAMHQVRSRTQGIL